MRSLGWSVPSLATLLLFTACSAGSGESPLGPGTGAGGSDADGAAGSQGEAGTGAGGEDLDSGAWFDAPLSEGGSPGCAFPDTDDHDGDGYRPIDGDCNDCDPLINPGAFDVVGGVDGGPGVDEDCDGIVDNEPVDCDPGIDIATQDAFQFARAIGLCRFPDPAATGKDRTWGVLNATLGTTDAFQPTNPKLHGVMTKFGTSNNPQEGVSMAVLSSGTARDEFTGGTDPNGTGYQSNISTPYPPGFPKNAPGCPGPGVLSQANDPSSLYLRIRAPTNAKSLRFKFKFFSAEYPEFVCTQFNDVFVALLFSQIPGDPAHSRNISFDQNGAPVCVNIGFFSVTAGNDPQLAGTFMSNGRGGATEWLQTQAPVQPGEEFDIHFIIWDTGDRQWDSTVLIDDFEWSVEPASEAVTEPVPVPK